jgi:hypothetical protein
MFIETKQKTWTKKEKFSQVFMKKKMTKIKGKEKFIITSFSDQNE